MAKSYLEIHKLNEYFHNTVSYVDDVLMCIRNFEVSSLAGGNFRATIEGKTATTSSYSCTLEISSYDQGLEYIRPFLPSTQFFLDKDGKTWLCGYTPTNSYKKSLSTERYHNVIPRFMAKRWNYHQEVDLRSPANYNTPEDMSLAEALEDTEQEGLTALSSDFALYDGECSRSPLVLYKSVPVAKVNGMGCIELHPKYHNLFNKPLSQFGDVVDARKRSF